jgi:hypothetical protein
MILTLTGASGADKSKLAKALIRLLPSAELSPGRVPVSTKVVGMVRIALRILLSLAFIATALWVYVDPKLETWAALATAGAALIGTFLHVLDGEAAQHQQASGGSTAIQAGGNVEIGKTRGRNGR